MSDARKWPEWLLRIFRCMRTPAKEPLKILDFSRGLLTDVPDEVYAHERTLEELYLNCNHLADLPRQLFSCDELRILDLHDNNISMLPPIISHLHNLVTLDLGNNNLQELPENLKNNKQLRVLMLNNNPLYKIPDVFQNLTGLTELYLNETALEFIPAHIGKLTHLKILELRDNILQDLPKTMHYLTKLERIDIGNNELHIFPVEICELFNLTELLLDQNHIESMPAGVGELVNLRHFDISCNNLVSLHQNIGYWTNLIDLIASQNSIEALPATIGNLKNLQIIKLDSNQIKTIPTSIGSLVELEELIITFNFVDILPERIGLLRKLKILHLDTNFLTSIPTELGSCTELTILSLRNNRLTRLPEELSNLKKLRVINVVDNNITYLPLAIGKMDLGAIWLNTNQAQPLVPLLPEDLGNEVVLNSVYLPQTNSREMSAMIREREYQKRTAKHLCFSDQDKMVEGLEPTSRLSRSPTPFPKDLRKHARPVPRPQPREEEMMLPSSLDHQPQPEEYRAVSTQGSEAIRRISPDPTSDVRPSTSSQTFSTVRANAYESSVLFFMSPKVARKTVSFVTGSVTIPHLPLTVEEDIDEASSSVNATDREGAVLAQESNPLIREARNIRTDYRSSTDSWDTISERTTLSAKKKHKPTRPRETHAVDPRAPKRCVPKLDLRIHPSTESFQRPTETSEFINPGSGQSGITIPTTHFSDGSLPGTFTQGSLQSSFIISTLNLDVNSRKQSLIRDFDGSGTLEYIRAITDNSDTFAHPTDNGSFEVDTHSSVISPRTRDIDFSGGSSSRTIPTPNSTDRFEETPRSSTNTGASRRTEDYPEQASSVDYTDRTMPSTPALENRSGSERSIVQDPISDHLERSALAPLKGEFQFSRSGHAMTSSADDTSAQSVHKSSSLVGALEDDRIEYTRTPQSGRTMSPSADDKSIKNVRKSTSSGATSGDREMGYIGTPQSGRTMFPSAGDRSTQSVHKSSSSIALAEDDRMGYTRTPQSGRTKSPSADDRSTKTARKSTCSGVPSGDGEIGYTGTPQSGRTMFPSVDDRSTDSVHKSSSSVALSEDARMGYTRTPKSGRTMHPSDNDRSTKNVRKSTSSGATSGDREMGYIGTPQSGRTMFPSAGDRSTQSVHKSSSSIALSEDDRMGYRRTPQSGRTMSPTADDRSTKSVYKLSSSGAPSGDDEMRYTRTPQSGRTMFPSADDRSTQSVHKSSSSIALSEDDRMGYTRTPKSGRTMSPSADYRHTTSARISTRSSAPSGDGEMGYTRTPQSGRTVSPYADDRFTKSNRSMNGRRTAPLFDDLEHLRASRMMSQTPLSTNSPTQRSTGSGDTRLTAEQPRRPSTNCSGENTQRSFRSAELSTPSERRAMDRESLRNEPLRTHFETDTVITNGSPKRNMSDVESIRSDYSVPLGSLSHSIGAHTLNGNAQRNISDAQGSGNYSGWGTSHELCPGMEAPRSTSDVESLRSDYSVPLGSLPHSAGAHTAMQNEYSHRSMSDAQSLRSDYCTPMPLGSPPRTPFQYSHRSTSDGQGSGNYSDWDTSHQLWTESASRSTLDLQTPQQQHVEAQIHSGDSQNRTRSEEISHRSISDVECIRSDSRIDVLPESSIINVQSRPPTPGHFESPRVDLTKRFVSTSDPGTRMSSRSQGKNIDSWRSESDGRKTSVKPRDPIPSSQTTIAAEKKVIDLETLREALGSVLGFQVPQRSPAITKSTGNAHSKGSLLDVDSFRTDSGDEWDSTLHTGDNSVRTISQDENKNSNRDHSPDSGDTRSQPRSTKSSHHSQKKTSINSPYSEEPQSSGVSKPHPPPYDIAKHYSTQAQYFEQEPGSLVRNTFAEEELAHIAGFERPCLSSVGEGSIPESPHTDEPTPHMFSERPAPGEHLVVPKPHRLSESASLGSPQSPFGARSSHSQSNSSHRQQETELTPSSMHSSPGTNSYMELSSNLADIMESSPSLSDPGTPGEIPPYSGSSDISQRSNLSSHGAVKEIEDPRCVKTADGRMGGHSDLSNKVSPTTPSKWMFGKHKNATVIDIVLDKPDDIGFEVSENHGDGIYVENVFLESASILQIGDKILAIEGQDVSRMTKEEVMLLLYNAASQISVMVSKQV